MEIPGQRFIAIIVVPLMLLITMGTLRSAMWSIVERDASKSYRKKKLNHMSMFWWIVWQIFDHKEQKKRKVNNHPHYISGKDCLFFLVDVDQIQKYRGSFFRIRYYYWAQLGLLGLDLIFVLVAFIFPVPYEAINNVLFVICVFAWIPTNLFMLIRMNYFFRRSEPWSYSNKDEKPRKYR